MITICRNRPLKGSLQCLSRCMSITMKTETILQSLKYDAERIERAKRWPNRGVHVFQCTDQLGVVAKISECIAARNANLLNVDLHIDFSSETPQFYIRSEFEFNCEKWERSKMTEDFQHLSDHFKASKNIVRVHGIDPNPKMAVLSSWQEHCLVDLLYKWQEKQLPVDITCVISNHNRKENSHVRRFLDRHKIPYHFLPTSKGDKRESDILELVKDNTDFLVLARYMQVLSGDFLRSYGKDIINIHHGLLPSFKGANPYKQAYFAGVKLIGATSHFVTENLDDGPIIEQLVERVSHRDTPPAFAQKSENLEKQCLATAVRYYCENRIFRYGGRKTIVFS